MFRRSHLILFFAAALLVVANIGTYAQSAPVSGTVELDTNGVKTPVAGALIEVYRTDIKSGFPSNKTGKDGRFSFAGLQIGGVFAFAVSAPGCAPVIFTGVKAGQEKLPIIMTPGDGKKYTEAEVRAYLARKPASGGETGELTPEQKKAQAENEAKRKEIEAKNAKAMSVNEIVNRTLKEGNDAFAAKNFDLAIAKYTEGIQADPTFVGTAPILLNNRAQSYRSRGVETFNKNIKLPDLAARAAGKLAAKTDFADSAESFLASINVIKNTPAADVSDPKNTEAARFEALAGVKETARVGVLTEQVDERLIAVAKVLIPEYIITETDPVKKAGASLILADMYLVVGDAENAIAGYRKILETSPDNVDALAGAGFSLVNLGYLSDDKAKFQEGSNLLQKFVGLAPDTHKLKADAVGLVERLKKEQNVAPQKVPGAIKKKP